MAQRDVRLHQPPPLGCAGGGGGRKDGIGRSLLVSTNKLFVSLREECVPLDLFSLIVFLLRLIHLKYYVTIIKVLLF